MSLRLRQVHLDFHTSEQIAGIGDRFDPKRFARTLKEAHVDSVTCFSRCHHGWIYHETRFPNRHPHLTRNLLKEQIEACHAEGIRVPIYITVGWDEWSARTHPEWLEVTPEGKLGQNGPLQAAWRKLCLNQTPYIDYVIAQTEEVLQTLPVDGLFFDIIFQHECCCQACLRSMADAGLNAANPADRKRHAATVVQRFTRRMTEAVRRLNTACSLFYNAGHVGPSIRDRLDCYSHLELESLPSGGWGYDHFPVTARFARLLGKEFLGMTGKFLRSWGDFGGFKTEAGLEYDCFTALALGGGCSVGDQLHPSGELNQVTYDLIGHVYRQVAEREPWVVGAQPVSEVAVLSPEAYATGGRALNPSLVGAMRMLQEAHLQFDIVDEAVEWERYRLLLLPDVIPVSPALRRRIDAYLEQGGAVLCSFESAVADVQLAGRSQYSTEYLKPSPELGAPPTETAVYAGGYQIAESTPCEVLGSASSPYFERSWLQFCSHNQTPHQPAGEKRAAIVQAGRVIYFAHPIFHLYTEYAARAYKQMVLGALNRLLPDPLVRSSAPSSARIMMNRQSEQRRTVMHLLHYIPERRAATYDVVEDVIPLHDITLSVRVDQPVQAAYLAPAGQPLPLRQAGGRIELTVPRLNGHAMVVLQE